MPVLSEVIKIPEKPILLPQEKERTLLNPQTGAGSSRLGTMTITLLQAPKVYKTFALNSEARLLASQK